MKGKLIAVLLVLALVIAGFSLGISRLETGHHQQDKALLEEVLHRTAVACFASEGFYPPDLDFLLSYSGVRYDPDRYFVRYEIFASNLMPDITVIEKSYEK